MTDSSVTGGSEVHRQALPEWLHERVREWYGEVPIWKAFLATLAAHILPMLVATILTMHAMVVFGFEEPLIGQVTNTLIVVFFVVGHYWVLHLVRSTFTKLTNRAEEYLGGETDAA